MIRFSLKCENDHVFESWFGSTGDFDKLKSAGMVTCTSCGSASVEKTLMTPQVSTSRKKEAAESLRKAESDAEKALAEMRKEVETNSEYVGLNFAKEARAMHDGDKEHRSIYGEAKPEEAKALIEEGVPVTPLPFMPKRNTN